MNWERYREEIDAISFDPHFCTRTQAALLAAPEKKGKTMKKMTKTALIAAAMATVMAVAAVAGYLLTRPEEVAQELGETVLAEAFAADDSTLIGESVTSNGVEITLMGMVSGRELSDFCTDVEESRTYFVLSQRRTDGTPCEIGQLMTTPLVSGYAPWQVNIFTLGGGYQGFTADGVAYYLFDCADLEIFADHTVYLAVYEGFVPSDAEFTVAADGTIDFADGYEGVAALFALEMDASRADPAAVEALLKENGIDIRA